MTTTESMHWASVLKLRHEVRQTDGSVGELQMSLAKAVYQTVAVPYANCNYYADITQPTPLLVGFLGRVARRLGVEGVDAQACFHLDQGMGGGKSHALVGIWHMIKNQSDFLASELGQAVSSEATRGGHALDLSDVVPVVLMGDSMSPGATDPRFGPATDLFGRFLWLLFSSDKDQMGRWLHFSSLGANKATLQAVFAEINRPVLVLIDELMDYAMALTDQSAIGGMPGEQAFLNALADAVDDQPRVALVVVMIRSDEDEAGYHPAAEEMREYLSARLQRNGETVTVTEPADFAQIIRRRLFAVGAIDHAAKRTAQGIVAAALDPWLTQVYGQLGSGRSISRLQDRIVDTYPFHPDLFDLVTKEWSIVQAFQRVRSTVAIFARTVLYWVNQHEAGEWAPDLIGPGDIPLQTDALEALLSSGVLAGNNRAIQGFRAVASTDVVRSGGGAGTSFALDAVLRSAGVDANQPSPALRMATACFSYSLVTRPQGARGATKAELLAAIAGSAVTYAAAEEVFNALIASPAEGGLGALERTRPTGGRGSERFYLSIKQTLNMYHVTAMQMVSNEVALERVWTRAQSLSKNGTFASVTCLDRPNDANVSATSIFSGVDGASNRLVVLDPRRWSLLNGNDTNTRADIDFAFGVTPGLATTFAASMVIAVVNTQRRNRARDRAKLAIAWEKVVEQLDRDDEEYVEACSRRDAARLLLDSDTRYAFQHYAYLLRTGTGLTVQYKAVPDGRTSLAGQDVWNDLVAGNRAVSAGALAPEYVAQLVTAGRFGRYLTPKEFFELPYGNPTWPLVATVEDLRNALYRLVTSEEWMLTDSEGNEIRPANPGQIQPASMQQSLRPRPSVDEEDETDETASENEHHGTGAATTASDKPASTSGMNQAKQDHGSQAPAYEVTRVKLPWSSVTDQSKRESIWSLVREVASLLDPARRSGDLQMMGLEIVVTARVGDTDGLAEKAKETLGVSISIEDEEI
ncbi:ATP-binding protein [Cryobacterium sp. Hz7]|uniref:DUF499 domain-containing protein n=1 Tax=Cryobacterium sp. Hz7 TaxID=1259166 RepID=UPI00106AE0CD|nr:DUF499 domain-containing protein [Cryobacterium sp. Hz7]TFB67194.1 ATP-binding protein [Cryobacterium sp. Hz7]